MVHTKQSPTLLLGASQRMMRSFSFEITSTPSPALVIEMASTHTHPMTVTQRAGDSPAEYPDFETFVGWLDEFVKYRITYVCVAIHAHAHEGGDGSHCLMPDPAPRLCASEVEARPGAVVALVASHVLHFPERLLAVC
jgi:hypothetical protein